MKAPRLRWILFAAGITFLVAVLLTSFKELERIKNAFETLDKRMDELVEEERKTQEFKQKIEYYNTPEGIARLAREQFNLVDRVKRFIKLRFLHRIKNIPAIPKP